MLTSTNNGNYISCILGLVNCVVVYIVTKLVLYLYFIEKIYIISVPKQSRFRTPTYIFNLALLVPYLALIILMALYRVTLVASEFPFHCTIGYQLPATAAVLAYGFLINCLYAGIFIKYYAFPNVAQQTSHQCSSLRMMAKRNLVAAIVSLIANTVNYAVMIAFQGQERGLLALSVSTIDITVIACFIHWATTHPGELQCTESTLQRGNGGDKCLKLEIKQHQEVVVLTEMASTHV
ncbi:hypothetical protein EC973_004745 [Apophysomyces ossiformis]|uniref:Uncharacterized protein n=1 Tax=Apophysomyces ossiformis TaxID=679940 RepID=A0A8H7ESD6_9FUNG|nr:hypothetical protein EC973_004745 [Apophysomyces ossiformis]